MPTPPTGLVRKRAPDDDDVAMYVDDSDDDEDGAVISKRTRDISHGCGFNGCAEVCQVTEGGRTLHVVNSPLRLLVTDPQLVARARDMARRVAAVPQEHLSAETLSTVASASAAATIIDRVRRPIHVEGSVTD